MDNLTVINKMIRELEAAKEQEQKQAVLKHISNVQLLCELFLEDETTEAAPPKKPATAISELEIKAMLGENSHREEKKIKQNHSDHEDANGDSIFDF